MEVTAARAGAKGRACCRGNREQGTSGRGAVGGELLLKGELTKAPPRPRSAPHPRRLLADDEEEDTVRLDLVDEEATRPVFEVGPRRMRDALRVAVPLTEVANGAAGSLPSGVDEALVGAVVPEEVAAGSSVLFLRDGDLIDDHIETAANSTPDQDSARLGLARIDLTKAPQGLHGLDIELEARAGSGSEERRYSSLFPHTGHAHRSKS